MQRIEINITTGERRVIALTAQEIAENQSRAAQEQADRARRPKTLTLEAIERLLRKTGLSQQDIDAEKT